MGGHVDSPNVPGTLCILSVATPTELPGHRFGGTIFPRAHPVLLGSVVTACAGNVHVMGNGLGSRDRRVACLAFLRGLGWHGVVGIVAGYAGFHGIVRRGNDLRKPCRSRRKVLVAQRTVSPLPRGPELKLGGIIHVVRCGTVTYFAGETSVIAPGVRLYHVVMTLDASLAAGVTRLQGRRLVQRRSPVMSDFSEIVRYQQLSYRHEQDDEYYQQDGQPLDLLGKLRPPGNDAVCILTNIHR